MSGNDPSTNLDVHQDQQSVEECEADIGCIQSTLIQHQSRRMMANDFRSKLGAFGVGRNMVQRKSQDGMEQESRPLTVFPPTSQRIRNAVARQGYCAQSVVV